MKIGDYVRTKEGIEKIICIEENFMDDNVTFYATDNDIWRSAYNGKYNGFTSRSNVIIKSSPNIIELIEIGDYVNGYLIDYIDDERRFIRSNRPYRDGMHLYKDLIKYGANFNQTLNFFEEDIKSIVTKEQFESMEYKIGE